MELRLTIGSFLLIVVPLSAVGQVINGDFEDGGAGWTAKPPAPGGSGPWEIDFPATGGNPGGRAQIHSPFGDSEGEGCINQTFDCADAGSGSTCEITFDYECGNKDAAMNTGRVRVYVNGAPEFTGPCVEDFSGVDWNKSVSVSASLCGVTEVRLCLNVDPGNNGYRASFDNVSAECQPVGPITNGDFEDGGAGWAAKPPAPGAGEPWEIYFPATGGNPGGRAQIHSPFGDSEGEGCINQTFDCISRKPGYGDALITVQILRDGEILTSTSQDVADGSDGLLHFDFPDVLVEPGEELFLDVFDQGELEFGWRFAGDTYGGGVRYVFGNPQPGTDWFLRTWGVENADQVNAPPWTGGWTNIQTPGSDMWQSFMPSFPLLTGVDIDLITGNPGNGDALITVQILRDGEIVTSTSLTVTDGFDGLLHFDFPDVLVTPGEELFLDVFDQGEGTFGWRFAGDTYGGGVRYVFGSPEPATDWLFQTWGAENTDQANTPPWTGGWTNIQTPGSDMWQSFTPSLPILTGVDIDLITGNPGLGDALVTAQIIRDGGILTSISQTVTDGFDGLLHFDFPDVLVTPGEELFLDVFDQGEGTFGWRFAGDTYGGGVRYVFGSPEPATDWFFRTWGAENADQANTPPWTGGWTHFQTPDSDMWQSFTPSLPLLGGVDIDLVDIDPSVPGTTGTCEITFDYECGNKDAAMNTGRVRVYVNGALAFTGPCVEDFSGVDWNKMVSVSASSCGVTELQLCLEVDPGNNGYRASFDNVSAQCQPPMPGDFDGDFDVDLDDYARFPDCMGGPGASPSPTRPVTPKDCLKVFDFEDDGDVDVQDLAALQEMFLQL